MKGQKKLKTPKLSTIQDLPSTVGLALLCTVGHHQKSLLVQKPNGDRRGILVSANPTVGFNSSSTFDFVASKSSKLVSLDSSICNLDNRSVLDPIRSSPSSSSIFQAKSCNFFSNKVNFTLWPSSILLAIVLVTSPCNNSTDSYMKTATEKPVNVTFYNCQYQNPNCPLMRV
ncbi:hypothetical protein M9H77_17320 [Catharanthus roseus]|uniref:Uncharacterized protein n=1 Tax=Catharanthus roseus TaxID=4058 RepID=A0ACC0B494_CATRO|nr:hypothetical protein M9H77_17320 [Catharanthus roseus]